MTRTGCAVAFLAGLILAAMSAWADPAYTCKQDGDVYSCDLIREPIKQQHLLNSERWVTPGSIYEATPWATLREVTGETALARAYALCRRYFWDIGSNACAPNSLSPGISMCSSVYDPPHFTLDACNAVSAKWQENDGQPGWYDAEVTAKPFIEDVARGLK